MNYSQDFTAAEDVYTPVQDQLFLGLPPLLLVLLLLLLIAAAAGGWMMGQGRRSTDGGSDAAAIWKAIDEAVRAAMTAHSDGLRDKATALSRTIDERLGRTLALAGGLKAAGALKTALKEPEPTREPPQGQARPSATPDRPSNTRDAPEGEPQTTAVTIERVNQVVIHNPPPSAGGSNSESGPTRAPPTEAERRDNIRKAVSDLNDHWRLKDARIEEIKAAHRELSAKA